ncbi:Protein croquemort-like protein [Leptotrombidium deliense]|uniref:Protein croquemort-like protein n=1 Tax=Leptotrombidium deliense TaxID=299467 RepID=A0A443SMI5_9ACAR|nr:Protein croquemort-like protein [Leptotrombidium deliense]
MNNNFMFFVITHYFRTFSRLLILIQFNVTNLTTFLLQKLILSPNSMSFESWRKVPFPIYTRIYIFNVTNAEDVVSTNSIPMLKQLDESFYVL